MLQELYCVLGYVLVSCKTDNTCMGRAPMSRELYCVLGYVLVSRKTNNTDWDVSPGYESCIVFSGMFL